MPNTDYLARIGGRLWRQATKHRGPVSHTLGYDAKGDEHELIAVPPRVAYRRSCGRTGGVTTIRTWQPHTHPMQGPEFLAAVQDGLDRREVALNRQTKRAKIAAAKARATKRARRFRQQAERAGRQLIRDGSGRRTLEGIRTIEEYGTAELRLEHRPAGRNEPRTSGAGRAHWSVLVNGDIYDAERTAPKTLPPSVMSTLAKLLDDELA